MASLRLARVDGLEVLLIPSKDYAPVLALVVMPGSGNNDWSHRFPVPTEREEIIQDRSE
jgi:hypothetical protein